MDEGGCSGGVELWMTEALVDWALAAGMEVGCPERRKRAGPWRGAGAGRARGGRRAVSRVSRGGVGLPGGGSDRGLWAGG